MSQKSVLELFDLSGKVALVTGASGHLGRELAIGLAEAGACVVAASRSAERGEEIARLLPVIETWETCCRNAGPSRLSFDCNRFRRCPETDRAHRYSR